MKELKHNSASSITSTVVAFAGWLRPAAMSLTFAILGFASAGVFAQQYITPNGIGDGSSWADAAGPDKLATFAADGSKILYLGAGEYTPSATISVAADKKIYGGYLADGTRPTSDLNSDGVISPWEFTNATIFDGSGNKKIFITAAGSMVDGMTFRNCTENSNNGGAAIQLSPANGTSYVLNCTFTKNTSTKSGLYHGGIVWLEDRAGSFGDVRNCYFYGNTAVNGGAISTDGGQNRSQGMTVENCVIVNNTATKGGGIYANIYGANCTFRITNCLIANNKAASGGAIMFHNRYNGNPTFIVENCTIVSNQTTTANQGALHLDAESTAVTYYPNIKNCIIWNNLNGTSIINCSSAKDNLKFNFDNNAIQGATAVVNTESRTTVLAASANPFTKALVTAGNTTDGSAEAATWRLMPGSTLVRAGLPELYTSTTATTDADSVPRLTSGLIDMGAYQNNGIVTTVHYATPNGNNDGSSWAKAANLPTILANAAEGDTIYLGPGTYTNAAGFTLDKTVTLIGGFDASTTDYRLDYREVDPDRPWHLKHRAILTTGSRTDGSKPAMTIPAGRASPTFDGLFFTGSKMGLEIQSGATIRNSVIAANGTSAGANDIGKGFWLNGVTSPVRIENCLIAGNRTGSGNNGATRGAAIRCDIASAYKNAEHPGFVTVVNCTIARGYSSNFASIIHSTGSSLSGAFIVVNTLFLGNNNGSNINDGDVALYNCGRDFTSNRSPATATDCTGNTPFSNFRNVASAVGEWTLDDDYRLVVNPANMPVLNTERVTLPTSDLLGYRHPAGTGALTNVGAYQHYPYTFTYTPATLNLTLPPVFSPTMAYAEGGKPSKPFYETFKFTSNPSTIAGYLKINDVVNLGLNQTVTLSASPVVPPASQDGTVYVDGYGTSVMNVTMESDPDAIPSQDGEGRYEIRTWKHWGWFQDKVTSTPDAKAILKNNITIDLFLGPIGLGAADNAYTGTMTGDVDENGDPKWTITINDDIIQPCYGALFNIINGATIENIRVRYNGDVQGGVGNNDNLEGVGGIAGDATTGTNTITNCHVIITKDFSSTRLSDGAGGGIVGRVTSGTLNINKCTVEALTGATMMSGRHSAGIVGRIYGGGAHSVTNSLVHIHKGARLGATLGNRRAAGICSYRSGGTMTCTNNTVYLEGSLQSDGDDDALNAFTPSANFTVTNCFYVYPVPSNSGQSFPALSPSGNFKIELDNNYVYQRGDVIATVGGLDKDPAAVYGTLKAGSADAAQFTGASAKVSVAATATIGGPYTAEMIFRNGESTVVPGVFTVTGQVTDAFGMSQRYIAGEGLGDKSGLNWANAAAISSLPSYTIATSLVDTVYIAAGDYSMSSGCNISKKVTILGGLDPQTNAVIGQSRLNATAAFRYFRLNVTNPFVLRNVAMVSNGTSWAGEGTVGGMGIAFMVNGNNALVENCDFINMLSTGPGGAIGTINTGDDANPIVGVFRNCRFIKVNGQYGGVLGCRANMKGSMTFENCEMRGGNASTTGTALIHLRGTLTMTNCLIANNNNTVVYMNDACTVNMNGCTVVNNSFTAIIGNAGGGTGTIKNSLIYNNGNSTIPASVIADTATQAFISRNVDPKFVDSNTVAYDAAVAELSVGDFRLKDYSLAVNYGDNDAVVAETDLDGSPRIYNNGVVDLGCYESAWKGVSFVTADTTHAVYDKTPHNIIFSTSPADIASDVVVTAAQTDAGTYAQTASYAEGTHWYGSSSTGNLIIAPATISNIAFDCVNNKVFGLADPDNSVGIASLTVNPAQVVDSQVLYSPFTGGAESPDFPTTPGRYIARLAVDANYMISGVDSIAFYTIEGTVPEMRISASESMVHEGAQVTATFTLPEPINAELVVDIAANIADWDGPATVTFPANQLTQTVTFTAKAAGLDRNATIGIAGIEPMLASPGDPTPVRITSDPMGNVRYMTAAGAGYKTGANWLNAASNDSFASFFNRSDIATLYLDTSRFQMASTIELISRIRLIGGYNAMTGLVTTEKTRITAPATNSRMFGHNFNAGIFRIENLDLVGNGDYGTSSTVGGGAIAFLMSDGEFLADNCSFRNHRISGMGGVFGVDANISGITATINNSHFSGNRGTNGAVLVHRSGAGGSFSFSQCDFIGNMAPSTAAGHGVFHARGILNFTNCLFANNGQTANAGSSCVIAVNTDVVTTATFTNCAFTNNSGGTIIYSTGANGTGAFRNSLIYGNSSTTWQTGGEDRFPRDAATIAMQEVNPMFTAPANFMGVTVTTFDNLDIALAADYTLLTGSPAINIGDNTVVASVTTDLAGNPRIHNSGNGGVVDCGPYETLFKGTAVISTVAVDTAYDGAAKNITWSVTPATAAGALTTPSAQTLPGTYSQEVSIGDDNWEAASSSANLVISKAVVDNILFNCAEGEIFALGDPSNSVSALSWRVTPIQPLTHTIQYYAEGSVTGGTTTFPGTAGRFYARFEFDTTLFQLSGKDSVGFEVIETTLPMVRISGPTQVEEGCPFNITATLSTAIDTPFTLTINASDVDFSGNTVLSFAAQQTVATTSLTANTIGTTRDAVITAGTVTPTETANPAGTVMLKITASGDVPTTRYVTLDGAGAKTGWNWANAAAGAAAITTFANEAGIDTIYIANGEYTGIHSINYVTNSKKYLALVGGFDEYGVPAPDAHAVFARPSTNTTDPLFIVNGMTDLATSRLYLERITFDGKGLAMTANPAGNDITGGVATEGVGVKFGTLTLIMESCRLTGHRTAANSTLTRYHSGIVAPGGSSFAAYVRNTVFDANFGRSSALVRAQVGHVIELDNCIAVGNGNVAGSNDMGLFLAAGGSITARNMLFANSTLTAGHTAGVFSINNAAGSIKIYNSTVVNNVMTTGLTTAGNLGNFYFYNSVFAGNDKNTLGAVGANVNNYFGTVADAKFIAPTTTAGTAGASLTADWRLQRGSPLINAGDNASATFATDADGNSRIYKINGEGIVDQGMYESEWRRMPTITLAELAVSKTYDATPLSLVVASTTPTDLPLGKTPSAFTNAGTYTDTVSTAGTNLWDELVVSGTVTINKATVTVTLTEPATENLIYTGSPILPTYNAVYDPVTTPEVPISLTYADTPRNVGSHTVGWTFSGPTAGNYVAGGGSSTTVTYIIEKASLTMTQMPSTADIVQGSPLSLSLFTGGSVAGPDSANVAGTWAWSNGSQTMGTLGINSEEAKFTPASGNYAELTENVDVNVIATAVIHITANATQSFPYNGVAVIPTYSVNVNGTTDVITYKKGLDAVDSIWETGTYTATISSTKTNYISDQTTITMNITKAPLTITPDSVVKLLGTADPELTWKVTEGMLYGTDTVAGALTRESGDAIGSYLITQGTLAVSDNYDMTLDTVYFRIVDPSAAVWEFAFTSATTSVNEGDAVQLTLASSNGLLPTAGTTVGMTFTGAAQSNQYVKPALFVFDGSSYSSTITLQTRNTGVAKADRDLVIGVATTDTVTAGSPAAIAVRIVNLNGATKDVVGMIHSALTVAEGQSINVPIEFIRKTGGTTENVTVNFSVIKPAHWVYGRDYFVSGNNVSMNGANFVATVPANTAGNVTITTLDNNRPGDGTRALTIRLLSVVGAPMGTATTTALKVTEVDQYPGTSPFSIQSFAMPAEIKLTGILNTLEADLSANPVVGVDNRSMFGAGISPAGGTAVNYSYNPAMVSSAVLAAGFVDTFNAYVSNSADMKPKPVTGMVYVAQDYTTGMPLSLSIDAVAERTGLPLTGFSVTPSLYGKYFRPYTAFDPGFDASTTKVMMKAAAVTAGDRSVDYTVTLSTKLYDLLALRTARAAGKFFDDVKNDPAVQLPVLGIEVWCSTAFDVNGAKVTVDSPVGALNIVAPTVSDCQVFTTEDGRRIAKVSGTCFGAQPKASLEYLNGTAISTASLARLTAAVDFTDGSSVTAAELSADPATSNVLWIVLPKSFPAGRCDLIIDSGNGLVSLTEIERK